jgi:hypothetical protein
MLLFQEQIGDNPHPEALIEIDESTPICTHYPEISPFGVPITPKSPQIPLIELS